VEHFYNNTNIEKKMIDFSNCSTWNNLKKRVDEFIKCSTWNIFDAKKSEHYDKIYSVYIKKNRLVILNNLDYIGNRPWNFEYKKDE